MKLWIGNTQLKNNANYKEYINEKYESRKTNKFDN